MHTLVIGLIALSVWAVLILVFLIAWNLRWFGIR